MSTSKSALRRLISGAAALALGLVGALSLGSFASAAPTPGNIDPAAVGSIIIHKHVKAEGSTAGNPAGSPLSGVTFRVTEILRSGVSIPLGTAEGWTAIDGLTPAGVATAPFSKGTATEHVTGSDGKVTAGGLKVGVYLVEEIDAGPNLITAPAAPFLVTIPMPVEATQTTPGGWLYNVDVYPKNELGSVTPTKTAGTPSKPADVVLGAIVPFTITVPVAKPALPYTSFSITDALSPGLEFSSWGAISIGGTALVATDYTISSNNNTVTLTAAGLVKLNAASANGATTVTAVINAKVTSVGQLKNKASVSINGTPGETPQVTTNWARVEITKQDKNNTATKLAGATFELYAENKTTLLATGTTDSFGKVSFIVWVGNNEDVTEVVYLKETVAPQGYVLPADPWTGPITLTAGTTAETSIKAHTIDNLKVAGPNLPMTGAAGTAAMSLGGLTLIGVGATAILVARRRRTTAA